MTDESEQVEAAAQAGLYLLNENHTLREQNDKLEADIKRMTSRLCKLNDERRIAILENKTLSEECERAQHKCQELQQQLADESNAAKQFKFELDQVHKQNELLQRGWDKSEQENHFTRHSQIDFDLYVYKSKLEQSQRENKCLRKEIKQLQQKNYAVRKISKQLEEQLDEMRVLKDQAISDAKERQILQLQLISYESHLYTLSQEQHDQQDLIESLREVVRVQKNSEKKKLDVAAVKRRPISTELEEHHRSKSEDQRNRNLKNIELPLKEIISESWRRYLNLDESILDLISTCNKVKNF